MSDLISRQAALNQITAIDTSIIPYVRAREYVDELKNYVIKIIETIPSVEPERHRGEWIEDGHERGFSECSKCGYIAVSVLSERHYNFCQNCGADMRLQNT